MIANIRQPFNNSYEVTLGFGDTYENLYTAKNPHKGVDFGCPQGTEILACHDGTVYKTGYEKNGYGNYIILKSEDTSGTLYAHLNAIMVQQGAVVTKGQQIAYSGSTGNSTGAHLHLEARTQCDKISTVFDPLSIMVYEYDTAGGSDTVRYAPIDGGLCTVVCDTANVRDSESMNIVGQLSLGAVIDVKADAKSHNGVPYHQIGESHLMIAEYDGWGTQILRNVESE